MKTLKDYINESVNILEDNASALVDLKASIKGIVGGRSNAESYMMGLGYAMDEIMFESNKKKNKITPELVKAYVTFVYEAFDAAEAWVIAQYDEEDEDMEEDMDWAVEKPDNFTRKALLDHIKEMEDFMPAISTGSGALFHGVWPETFAAHIQDSRASGKDKKNKEDLLEAYRVYCTTLGIDPLI